MPKLCVNCKYFIPDGVRWPDEVPDNSKLGKCKLYGDFDLVTEETKYDYAHSVRNDFYKCGEKGKLYEDYEISSQILTNVK